MQTRAEIQAAKAQTLEKDKRKKSAKSRSASPRKAGASKSPEKSKQKTTSNIKQVVINLTNTELTEQQKSQQNLRLDFVPAVKKNIFYGHYFS